MSGPTPSMSDEVTPTVAPDGGPIAPDGGAIDTDDTPATSAFIRRRFFRNSGSPRSFRLWVGVVIAVALVGTTAIAMIVFDITPVEADSSRRLRAVGEEGSLLGTDQLGRDLFQWTIAGFAWSGAVAAVAATIVTMIGLVVGVIAGSSKGFMQSAAARLIDTTLSLPYLVIAVAIMAAIGRGFWPLAITLGSVSWPIFARVIYAETRGLMQREYVKAARLLGVSRFRSLVTHVLPGLRNTIMVMWAFMFADLLVAESGLSFLGIGAPLGTPSLGNILADGRLYLLVAPRMVIVPAAAIVLSVTAANMIGDGVAARHRQRTTVVQG